MRWIWTVVVLLSSSLVFADEGMWAYDNFPSATVKKLYGFGPDHAWLDEVRMSTVRLAQGCSGSFVSGQGLILTNHHCSHQCIEQLSNAKQDYVATGFFAKTNQEEVKCPELEVNQLIGITDVTERVKAATAGKTEAAFHTALKAVMASIEKECAKTDDLRCDVVTLYHGGQYHLYTYRRYQDVRLVFAPEFATAFFGGDPDNFMFPRYDLDMSMLRIYEHDQPVATPHHLKWSRTGAKPQELTFVSGHPGNTSREQTVAELEYQRDVMLPERLLLLAEMRGLFTEYQHRGPEQKRHSSMLLFAIENGFKARKGMYEALLDKNLVAEKVKTESALKQAVAKDGMLNSKASDAWHAIELALQHAARIRERLSFIEDGLGFRSELFFMARTLVRAGDELVKPNSERLREFGDAGLPELKQELFSEAPMYPEFEIAKLTWSLTKMREHLGVDNPLVKKVLGKDSPEKLALALIQSTKLSDIAVRKALFEGGKTAVAASNDPMIKLARLIDPEARTIRREYEDQIEAVITKNTELIAQVRFAVLGNQVYPDATFTLRLSYGKVEGWEEQGHTIEPFTTLAGAFDRHTGEDPFALPASWLAKRKQLNLTTHFNFVTTNDIIGGNSGSPVLNKDRQLIGLIFDGNLASLGGEYGFNPANNRAVAVDSAAMTEALIKIYGAARLVEEMTK